MFMVPLGSCHPYLPDFWRMPSFPSSLYIHTYLLLTPLELWPTTPHFSAIYILDFQEKVFQYQIPLIALATLVYIAFLFSHLGCLFTPKFLVALVLYPVTCYFRSPSFCLRIRKWLIRFWKTSNWIVHLNFTFSCSPASLHLVKYHREKLTHWPAVPIVKVLSFIVKKKKNDIITSS